MSENNKEDTVFSRLLSEIDAHKNSGNKGYPLPLRKKIMDYISTTNITINNFGIRSGITPGTIGRWFKEDGDVEEPKKKEPVPLLNPVPKRDPVSEISNPKPVVDVKATIRVDGFEVDVPISHLGLVLKQLRNS